MLLRDAPEAGGGLQVFVLHRVAGMAFAPSVTVFPGGAVDPTDSLPVPWSGPDRGWWAAALGTEIGMAEALVVAAVRELFEETGVLLADGVVPDPAREAVTDHRMSLADVLVAAGLHLQSERLRPWANWITPAGSARRYDTFFFAAELPEGQEAQLLTTEAESGRWAHPADLLAEHAAGALAIMPPTRAMLTELTEAGSVRSVLDQRRPVVSVTPTVTSRPGEPLRVDVAGPSFGVRRAANP